jgi:uncharacterized membrane protein (DUF106 family)
LEIKIDGQIAWSVIRRVAAALDHSSSPRAEEIFPNVLKPLVPEMRPALSVVVLGVILGVVLGNDTRRITCLAKWSID